MPHFFLYDGTLGTRGCSSMRRFIHLDRRACSTRPLHNMPDKVAQDHFPRWVMADGSGGSADVGGSLCRSKDSFSLAHRIKTRVEIQQIKCRNVQHPLIL